MQVPLVALVASVIAISTLTLPTHALGKQPLAPPDTLPAVRMLPGPVDTVIADSDAKGNLIRSVQLFGNVDTISQITWSYVDNGKTVYDTTSISLTGKLALDSIKYSYTLTDSGNSN